MLESKKGDRPNTVDEIRLMWRFVGHIRCPHPEKQESAPHQVVHIRCTPFWAKYGDRNVATPIWPTSGCTGPLKSEHP